MRPVNLVPQDQRRGEQAPLRAGALSYLTVGALALVLLALVGVVLANNQINDRKSELKGLQVREEAAQQKADALAPYGEFASLSEARHATVVSLAESRFDWERVLNELARVIPDDVWLEDVTGKVSPDVSITGSASAGSTSSTTTNGPSLSISGCAVGQEAVARFVAALKDIDGVTRVGLQQSALGNSASGSSSSASAASGSSTTGGCQTKDFIAAFQITVAFDAVPTPPVPSTAPTAGATPTTTTSTSTPTTTTADDGGVAATEAEQQSATDSAAQQSSEAQTAATGAGG